MPAGLIGDESQQPIVIPAQAGIQRLSPPKSLGPRLRGDDVVL